MLLTTAVYFKGTWQHAFDKTATRTRCFDVPGTGCHQVPLMENVANYKYAEVPALDAQVVQIPYTVSKLTRFIISSWHPRGWLLPFFPAADFDNQRVFLELSVCLMIPQKAYFCVMVVFIRFS